MSNRAEVLDPADVTAPVIHGAGEKKTSSAAWLVPAIISFVAALGGGILTAYTTTRNAHDSKIEDLKTAAYSDYATAQGLFQFAANDDARQKADLGVHQVDIRLALYGDEDAVLAIANFMRIKSRLRTCTKRDAVDLAMYESIRKGIVGLPKNDGLRAAMAVVILGCDRPPASATAT